MKDIINLNSRYEEKNLLKRLKKLNDSESKTYVLKVANPYLRTGEINNHKKFIDPSGGPMITEGEYLEEAGAVVKSINFTAGYGYTITFE